MKDDTLFALPPEDLRTEVMHALRKHRVVPRVSEGFVPVAAQRVEETSRAVLDAMLTRQFRVGPLPPPEVYEQLLERVRRCVARGRPVAVTIGYGPLKNPNAVPYSTADWAEFFALCHLVAWHNKVAAIYPPGLSMNIAFDDSTLVMANHADKRRIRSYTASVGELLHTLGYTPVLSASLKHSYFAWLFHFGVYQIARCRVFLWERDPNHHEQMERMALFARRNVVLPSGLSSTQQDAYVRAASHRYRVYWDALQLSGVTNSKSRLIAMYLDGSQHHLKQAVAFHLTTVDKGQITQPWQGIGVLLDNEHGGLEPFVLTGGRQQRYDTRTIDGLDVVPLPGFDRINVARLKFAAAPSTTTETSAEAPARATTV
ncbi:MAG TPA: L-tyrosine/L-tryptophan isonitrile synthase family protein [Gemmataceae bacterium]|jgi:hypothetical protein|nr:L-tyrosine/L-tryptophan isonitrile synthase family protein [Gemmataceae bacterium]